jgi:YgiT-type zinc finger domain-containing protein
MSVRCAMFESCPVCGGPTAHVREIRDITVGHRTVAVEHEFDHCPTCREGFFEPGAMNALLARAREKLQEQDENLPATGTASLRGGRRLKADKRRPS